MELEGSMTERLAQPSADAVCLMLACSINIQRYPANFTSLGHGSECWSNLGTFSCIYPWNLAEFFGHPPGPRVECEICVENWVL